MSVDNSPELLNASKHSDIAMRAVPGLGRSILCRFRVSLCVERRWKVAVGLASAKAPRAKPSGLYPSLLQCRASI